MSTIGAKKTRVIGFRGASPTEKRKRRTDPHHAKSVEEVVNYCKSNGMMLWCRRAYGGCFESRLEDDKCQLFSAVARPAGSWVDSDQEYTEGEPCPLRVQRSLLDEMNRLVADDEHHDISKVATKPVERTFVYFDISDFSKQPAAEQAIVINTLTSLSSKSSEWESAVDDPRTALERSLCIGDGFIFAFTDAAFATFFAAYLARRIEVAVAESEVIAFHFRSGVHTGPVYRFWDGSDWNYVGKGINDARRVLEAIGTEQDDVAFISADTRTRIMSRGMRDIFDPTVEHLQNRGRKSDKHGGLHRVYELNHSAWIGPILG